MPIDASIFIREGEERWTLALVHRGVSSSGDAGFTALQCARGDHLARALGAVGRRTLFSAVPWLSGFLRETRAPWVRRLLGLHVNAGAHDSVQRAPDFIELFELTGSTSVLRDRQVRAALSLHVLRLGESAHSQALVCRVSELCAVEQVPGLSALMLLSRARELDREAMHRYWREQHAPLVLGLRSALGFTGYQQLHALTPPELPTALAPSHFDGIAALSFSSRWSLLHNLFSPAAQRANLALVRDEPQFIDPDSSVLFLGAPQELSSPGVRSWRA